MRVEIREVLSSELRKAFAVLHQLRTNLTEELFLQRLERQRLQLRYRLVGAYAPELVGLVGMRPVETMARGDHLHVDDLVVVEQLRGRGIGTQLLAFAESQARALGMGAVFLDSRAEAMPFYQHQGYEPHTATLVRKQLK